jgi:hypothetical protein
MTDTPDPRIEVIARAIFQERNRYDWHEDWVYVVRDFPVYAESYRATARHVIESLEEAGLA